MHIIYFSGFSFTKLTMVKTTLQVNNIKMGTPERSLKGVGGVMIYNILTISSVGIRISEKIFKTYF